MEKINCGRHRSPLTLRRSSAVTFPGFTFLGQGGLMSSVFLSGGTHGDWQDKVRAQFDHTEFFDPRTLKGQDMRTIAETEMGWLHRTDFLFFYLEASNPSGLGSAFEVGHCC